jgi:peroxiredoxin
MLKPRQPVPVLDVPLASGGRWVLSDQHPDRFTLIVFYRGVHCQLCRAYLTELNGMLDKFAEVGTSPVVAISADQADRAARAVAEWGLDRLPIGYQHSIESARRWGLYISTALREGQPDEFHEPGLFLIRPDGTLYATVLNTMPFMRPRLDDVVETIRWVNEQDYPARGEL